MRAKLRPLDTRGTQLQESVNKKKSLWYQQNEKLKTSKGSKTKKNTKNVREEKTETTADKEEEEAEAEKKNK